MCMFPVRTRCRTVRASSSRRGGCKRPRVMKCDAGLWLRSSPNVILAKIFSLAHHLFAARLLVSRTASSPEPRCTLMVLDVSCAFLYADINRRVYIDLPAEDPGSISGKVVGKLEKAFYGTRDAPQAWLDELSKTLVVIGFTMSARFQGLDFHERLEVALVTHVDDLLCGGSEENLNWVRAELSKKYEVKGQVMKTPSIGMSC